MISKYLEAWIAEHSPLLQQPLSAIQQQHIIHLWYASDYALKKHQRHPEWLPLLLQTISISADIKNRLQVALQPVNNETDLMQVLRQFRHQQLIRIIYRDINRLASLTETLHDLTELADQCVQQALDLLYQWQVAKQGEPQNSQGEAQHLLILAMGKQGAKELNLSSDIDLIFVFPEKGKTNGRRAIDNEVFFTQLCRRLIKVIGAKTEDGFVFRVDTRLRPFGESGPLVVNFAFFESYYSRQAREWERYAMIKARIIAGQEKDKKSLKQLIQPFVYRRYLDFMVIEQLRKMKALIKADIAKKGREQNIKLGYGGIREIEFIGQLFQLMRGGQDTTLQIRPILDVLNILEKQAYLPTKVVKTLTDAYTFLRLSENRIQAWQDQQTHLLPEDEAGQARLAWSMGFKDWAEYQQVLEQHRKQVQCHFDHLIAAPKQENTIPPWQEDWLHLQENKESLLKKSVFSLAMIEQLLIFKNKIKKSLSAKGQHLLDELMPLLLQEATQQSQPDLALERALDLLYQMRTRTSYLFLLYEYPQALALMVQLIHQSLWIFTQLKQQPILLDTLLAYRFRPLKKTALELELEQRLSSIDSDDLESQMEICRQFANANKFKIAIADCTGQIPLAEISHALTQIAEVLLAKGLAICWAQLIQQYGKPSHTNEIAIIGYGKLGGAELSYQSDLDLIFIRSDRKGNTDGKKQISIEPFYVRLIQRLVHFFSTQTVSGRLYDIDLRLRPNGNSGLLVTTFERFVEYQKNQAWTWEHQALVRARAITGDTNLIEKYTQARSLILQTAVKQASLLSEIQKMRIKMRQSLDQSNSTRFDLKQGQGGIVDIEFIVQYGVLKYARKSLNLTQYYDNIPLLNELITAGFLLSEQAQQLEQSYQCYRKWVHLKALNCEPPFVAQTELQKERQAIIQLWQNLIENEV